MNSDKKNVWKNGEHQWNSLQSQVGESAFDGTVIVPEVDHTHNLMFKVRNNTDKSSRKVINTIYFYARKLLNKIPLRSNWNVNFFIKDKKSGKVSCKATLKRERNQPIHIVVESENPKRAIRDTLFRMLKIVKNERRKKPNRGYFNLIKA